MKSPLAVVLVLAIIVGCSTLDLSDKAKDEAPESNFQSKMTANAEPSSAEVYTALDFSEEGDEYSKALSEKLQKARTKNRSPASSSNDGTAEPNSATVSNEISTNQADALAGAEIPSGPRKIITYKIKAGDTLMKISFQFLGNVYRWKEIYKLNQSVISNFNKPPIGQTIKIDVTQRVAVKKEGRPYGIKWGDSLVKVSKWLYGNMSKWKDLWKNNPQLIHNPNKIYAGFKMYYKGKTLQDRKGPSTNEALRNPSDETLKN